MFRCFRYQQRGLAPSVLIWPTYFADRAKAPPVPEMRFDVKAMARRWRPSTDTSRKVRSTASCRHCARPAYSSTATPTRCRPRQCGRLLTSCQRPPSKPSPPVAISRRGKALAASTIALPAGSPQKSRRRSANRKPASPIRPWAPTYSGRGAASRRAAGMDPRLGRGDPPAPAYCPQPPLDCCRGHKLTRR